jgi:alpha-glucoside transport system permease protein
VKRLRFAPARVALVVAALMWAIPTIGLLVTALRPQSESVRTGWWRVLVEPSQLTLDNFRAVLESDFFARSIVNTFAITIPSVVGVVVVAALAAYAFAWNVFPGRDGLFVTVVGLLVVPLQMALIPVARLYNTLGIFGSITGVVLFHIAFGLPFAIFLLRNFFAGIPKELLEAARLDGASEARIFRSVILPLGVPAIASLSIFQFLWVWNDLLVALVFAETRAAPITVAIQQQLRQFGGNLDIISAASFVSMMIPLVVFFAFQRYFAEGLLAGAVK